MAKLTKKQIKELETILYHIKRAEKYLKRDDIVGIATKTDSPNGASYQIINPECSPIKAIDCMNKFVGSDIIGLYAASQLLESFLGSD